MVTPIKRRVVEIPLSDGVLECGVCLGVDPQPSTPELRYVVVLVTRECDRVEASRMWTGDLILAMVHYKMWEHKLMANAAIARCIMADDVPDEVDDLDDRR